MKLYHLLMLGFDYIYLESIIWDCAQPQKFLTYFKPIIYLCNCLPIGFLLRGAYGDCSNPIFTDPVIQVKAKVNPLLHIKAVQGFRIILKHLLQVD